MKKKRPIRRALTPRLFFVRPGHLKYLGPGHGDLLPLQAVVALRIASRMLPEYAPHDGRRAFSQWQLLAALSLRRHSGRTYRELSRWLTDAPALRLALGLWTVPHYSTLCKFARRVARPYLADRVAQRALRVMRRFALWTRRGRRVLAEYGPGWDRYYGDDGRLVQERIGGITYHYAKDGRVWESGL